MLFSKYNAGDATSIRSKLGSPARYTRIRRLTLEPLEDRQLMTVDFWNFTAGTGIMFDVPMVIRDVPIVASRGSTQNISDSGSNQNNDSQSSISGTKDPAVPCYGLWGGTPPGIPTMPVSGSNPDSTGNETAQSFSIALMSKFAPVDDVVPIPVYGPITSPTPGIPTIPVVGPNDVVSTSAHGPTISTADGVPTQNIPTSPTLTLRAPSDVPGTEIATNLILGLATTPTVDILADGLPVPGDATSLTETPALGLVVIDKQRIPAIVDGKAVDSFQVRAAHVDDLALLSDFGPSADGAVQLTGANSHATTRAFKSGDGSGDRGGVRLPVHQALLQSNDSKTPNISKPTVANDILGTVLPALHDDTMSRWAAIDQVMARFATGQSADEQAQDGQVTAVMPATAEPYPTESSRWGSAASWQYVTLTAAMAATVWRWRRKSEKQIQNELH